MTSCTPSPRATLKCVGAYALGPSTVDELSLVRKDGTVATTLWRQRGVLDRDSAAAAAQPLR